MEKEITNEIITKGFKVTNTDFSCNGLVYELDKIFVHEGEIKICYSGFHFCQIANDCFNYYSFKSENRVFEIEAYGVVDIKDDKHCAGKIKFLRELSWIEVLRIVNTGKDNTGMGNSGDRNSGNWNSGDRNSGDRNIGDRNSGDRNSGDRNSGDSNSGYRNSGNRNSGEWNIGDRNSGNWNIGDRNSGNCNSGEWNSGNRNSGEWNSGDRNSGNWNSGDRNSGEWNSGDRNSGNWNSGDRNSGDSNSGYRNSGAFCLDNNPYLILFDLPTKIKVKDWEEMEACKLMYSIEPTIWMPQSIMTDKEKLDNPGYETTNGYLKKILMKDAWANFWGKLTDKKKEIFTSLPNFDIVKFEAITGIKIK